MAWAVWPSCQRNSDGPKEEAGPQLPPHHVGPLVHEDGKVPVALNPLGVHVVDDGLGGGPDGQWLLQLLPPCLGHHRQLRGEPLHVLLFPLDEAHGDQEGEIGVLVPRILEEAIQALLHVLPDAVTPGPDDHAPPDRGVVCQLGFQTTSLYQALKSSARGVSPFLSAMRFFRF